MGGWRSTPPKSAPAPRRRCVTADGPEIARPLVLLRATADEAAGAGLMVGGLTVAARAIKQLSRMGYRLIVATDGTVALPPGLPADLEVRALAGPAAADDLAAELG